MGIYIYTLRKRTANVTTASGTETAQLMTYSYKEWLSFAWDDATEARRDAVRRRAERTAEQAAEGGIARLVILGDKPQDGAPVYTDVTSPLWVDTAAFPGRLAGYLRKRGGRWHLVDATPWAPSWRQPQGQTERIKYWQRDRLTQDGQSYREEIRDDEAQLSDRHATGPIWGLQGREQPQVIDPQRPEEIEIRVCWR